MTEGRTHFPVEPWALTEIGLDMASLAVNESVFALANGVHPTVRWFEMLPIIAGFGLLYTIPSLALFVLMPAIIGTNILSSLNVVVGLTLYTLALLVRTVSGSEQQWLARGATKRTRNRIAVTVRAESYEQQIAVIALVRRIAGWTGSMADAANIAVLCAGAGPDVPGPGNSFEQTQDFRVTFEEPA